MAAKSDIIGPTSSYYVSQRLRLHYVDWGNEDKPLLILIHGGRDHARSWDQVARELRDDYHVVAPDLRGHGDSAWAQGGHYSISEFVLDIARLLEACDSFPVTVVGHSLGGNVAIHYTAVYPDRVSKLVSIEGLGPPPEVIHQRIQKPLWERTAEWIEQLREFSRRQPRRYPSVESAAARMRQENPFLSEEQARHLTQHAIARNEDGTFTWKFDNYVRVSAPSRWDAEETLALWGRIACPTLLMRGTQGWASDPTLDGRLDAFQNARVCNVEGAGHWVHHDRLEEFLGQVTSFLSD